MLLVSEGNEPMWEGEDDFRKESEVLEEVELSLNSVVGLSEPRTLKLKGEIHVLEVVILIDCGATHNFISTKLIEAVQIPVQETSRYGGVIGSSKQLKGMGVCKGVLLKLQHITIVEDFLPLPLGSTDVILGIKWLATLGETHADWKNITMAFELGGQTVVLQRDPILTKAWYH